jgi:uncharacterized protein YjlB
MKQRGVTKQANELIVVQYQKILDTQLLTHNEAFLKKKHEIKGVNMSGRTLRKIFNFHHVHINTYKRAFEQFGKEWILTDNKIDIPNEEPEL